MSSAKGTMTTILSPPQYVNIDLIIIESWLLISGGFLFRQPIINNHAFIYTWHCVTEDLFSQNMIKEPVLSTCKFKEV